MPPPSNLLFFISINLPKSTMTGPLISACVRLIVYDFIQYYMWWSISSYLGCLFWCDVCRGLCQRTINVCLPHGVDKPNNESPFGCTHHKTWRWIGVHITVCLHVCACLCTLVCVWGGVCARACVCIRAVHILYVERKKCPPLSVYISQFCSFSIFS